MLTPGIALIKPIAPLIAPMKPLIIRQAVLNTLFTALDTAPLIPLAIAVPTFEKIDLILFQIPLKNPTMLLNALLMLLTALLKILPNHEPTPLNTPLMKFQIPLKKDFSALKAFFSPVLASIGVLSLARLLLFK